MIKLVTIIYLPYQGNPKGGVGALPFFVLNQLVFHRQSNFQFFLLINIFERVSVWLSFPIVAGTYEIRIGDDKPSNSIT